MKVNNLKTMQAGYITGLQPVAANASAYLQPDGHFGLNNAGVFWTSAGAVLVDTAYDVPRARKIAEAITHASRAPNHVEALILTHDHGDHSWGACAIATQRVVMSETAAAALKQSTANISVRFSHLEGEARAMMETLLADKFDFSEVRYRPPTETFSGEATLKIGDTALRLIEFRDVHTVSDSIVVDESEGVAVTGDLMFADSHIPLFMPTALRWAQVMDEFLKLDADTFIPGHGRLCNRDDVREHRDYLLWVYDAVESRARRGMSVEEAADDLVRDLGPYRHFQRADNLVGTVDVLYGVIKPDHPRSTHAESLALRWRFRNRWRGHLPNVAEPLPLNTRLGGFRTLAELRMI